jgi:ABC-type iron transport system FetAB permease component
LFAISGEKKLVDLEKESDLMKYDVTKTIFWWLLVFMLQVFVVGFVLPALFSLPSWFGFFGGILVVGLDLLFVFKFVLKL